MIDQPEPPAPNRRLVVLPRARTELAAAYAWYEGQRAGLGGELLRVVDAVLQRIQQEPALHPIVRPRIRRALVRRFPYGVFYTEYPDRVAVLAVVHARRDPRRWPSSPAR